MKATPLIRLALNPRAQTVSCSSSLERSFGNEAAKEAINFHRSIPGFRPTPLHDQRNRAQELGLGQLFVKDESHRLGLSSFKPLGASFAVASLLSRKYEVPLSWSSLRAPAVRGRIQQLTLVAATTGNHGRAVAWCAQQLGCQAVIFVPTDTAILQIDAIRLHGADAIVIDGNYDQTVLIAANEARQPNHLLIQDTAWRGYEEIPRLIMQGYLTLIAEAIGQIDRIKPSHVFLQVGVGSFAAAIVAHFCVTSGGERPKFIVVEPYPVGTYYESISRGRLEPLTNEDAGSLASGQSEYAVPSLLAWEILRDHADAFINCSHDISKIGQRSYANPIGDDARIDSGEMGAVTMGVLENLMKRSEARPIRELLNLNDRSRVLLISTEG